MTRQPIDRLDDIAAASDAISDDLSRGGLTDGLIFDAIRVRLIEIRQAAKHLPPDLQTQTSWIPWKEIAGMRDRLAHRYFDTSHAILERTVSTDLPELRDAIELLRTWLTSQSEGTRRSRPLPSSKLPTIQSSVVVEANAASVPGANRGVSTMSSARHGHSKTY